MVQNTAKFFQVVEKKLSECEYMRFDRFIIQHMGYEMTGDEEKARKDAYHMFLYRIGEERPASLPTIRRWFGIRGFRTPSREQIFRIAFSLRLGVTETAEYLMKGICEPSFQINDYAEIIAMYCLENEISFAKYEQIVQEYETNLESNREISREANTQWLFHQFEHIKRYSKEDFMYWMWENAGIFKGYSRTVQEYLNKYRETVLEFMRQDVKKRLNLLLSETGYEVWRDKRKHVSGEKEGELIKKFVNWDKKLKKRKIPEHLGRNILELTRLAYSETGLNTRLISELFMVSGKHTSLPDVLPEQTVRIVSNKYLSDLFHIPERNEMRIHIRQAIQELACSEEKEASCPEHIRDLIQEYSRGTVVIKNAEEALDWLNEYDKAAKRRRLIVGRGDLLPMILYVAQQTYLKKTGETKNSYHQEEAKKVFVNMANATMIACNMAPLDEQYIFDMVLLACFQKDDMYGYEDVLELV